MNIKKISWQSLRQDVCMLSFTRDMIDCQHSLFCQIPKKMMPYVNVLTVTRTKWIFSKCNRTFVVFAYLNLTKFLTM